MSEKILNLGDNYRAVVVWDDAAGKPDFEGAPVVEIHFAGYGTRVSAINDEANGYEEYIENFRYRYGNDWDLLTRALKIVFGCTTVKQFDTQNGTYFVFDPEDLMADDGKYRAGWVETTATEFEAWVNGECYGVKVEKLVTGRIVFDDSSRDPEDFCEWEEIDSVWGFYGDWILEDANLAETAKDLAGLPTFKSTYGY